MPTYTLPALPPPDYDLETKEILLQLNKANKQLAMLKGVTQSIPNTTILINTLTLQEAKDSSAVENIVTTHDELYRAELSSHIRQFSIASKEVLNYRQALNQGYQLVKEHRLLTNTSIKNIHQYLEGNSAGFRAVPGTCLKNAAGQVIYTPPQEGYLVEDYMRELEAFINQSIPCALDPLIKMSIIHHQFESIHPFYDGNGRTGRIISILYLVLTDLLETPTLYLSRFINQNKPEYYARLQAIRESEGAAQEKAWQQWILFNLRGVESTARSTIALVKGIRGLMQEYKNILRNGLGRQYSQDLLNQLFYQPYTKISFIADSLGITRQSATKYLDKIVELNLLSKAKIGRSNYYINDQLIELFIEHGLVNLRLEGLDGANSTTDSGESIESYTETMIQFIRDNEDK